MRTHAKPRLGWLRPAIALVAALGFPASFWAWDNEFGHDELTKQAARFLELESPVDRYLADELGFDSDSTAFQLGLDNAIDADARGAGERFEFILDRERKKPPVEVVLNEAPCARDAAFGSCFEIKQRHTARQWIRLGAFAEDNPNPRSQHHFHDPVFEHAPPTGNHGLHDDRLPGTIDDFLNDVGVELSGRGANPTRSKFRYILTAFGFGEKDFDGKGRSAVDRALNRALGTSPPSGENPINIHALPDAERYLFRAISSEYPDERELYASAHLIAVGHALHLLQDMGSAGHTRNDFIIEHVLYSNDLREARSLLGFLDAAPNIDEAPRDGANAAGSSVLSAINANPIGTSLPYRFLSQNPDPSFSLADYSPSNGLPDPETLAGLDVSELWDQGAQDSPSGLGLAEFTNRNFLSAGTRKGEYPLPAVASCKQLGTPGQGTWGTDLPARTLRTGIRNLTGSVDRQRYISSRLVPHLAQCRAICQGPARFLVPDKLCVGSPSDESVLRDYIEIEWAYAIRYGEALLRKLLSPRIDIIPTGNSEFRIANLTPHELRFDPSAISIWYETHDTATGQMRRVEAPVDCGSGVLVLDPAPAVGKPGPTSSFTCDLPASLAVPAAIHDDFFVVARGKWGERGTVGTPAELEASGDYAVAFRRVLGRQIVFHQDTERAGTSDDTVIHDVVLAQFSIEGALGGTPHFRTRNLTTQLRAQINADVAVDFGSPSAEPFGTRFAFGGDVQLDAGTNELIPSEFYVVDLTDPSTFLVQETPPTQLPVSGYHSAGPKWGSPFDEIVYSGNGIGSPIAKSKIVRHTVNSIQAGAVSTGESDTVVAAVKFGRAVGPGFSVSGSERSDDLFVLDMATGRRTHRLAFAPTVGSPRAIPCSEPGDEICREDPGDSTGHSSSPAFAPGPDSRLAFVGRMLEDSSGRIYTVDLTNPTNSPIVELPGDARVALYNALSGDDLGDVAWSLDGRWILFNSAAQGSLQTGGIWATLAPGQGIQLPSFEVLPFGGRGFSFLPDLVLPAP